MILKIEKIFVKDIEKLNIELKTKIFILSKIIENNDDLKIIFNQYDIKKLKGYNFYYRIRFGDFRLVFKIQDNIISFLRFKNRKDIYKYF